MSAKTVTLAYDPNLKQAEAHKLASKYRGFCGGWGNGKTTWGCVEFFVSLLEFPGTNAIISRKTRPELRSTTWDMWINGDTQETGWHGVPKEVIRLYNKSDLYMEFKNGSKIHGLPLDDPKKLENYNLGLFWIDQAEEVEEDIILKFHGRLRQHLSPREGLLTFNPNGHNHLWRMFIDPNRDPKYKRLYQCVEATPFDNPNLPEDYFEQFEGLPKHWYERFVLGSHEVFTGQIFVDYDPDTHVIDPFHIPSSWERWRAIDPGIRHEGACVWVARDILGNCFYYREIVEPGHDVAWWSTSILEAEAQDDWGGPDEEIYRSLIGPESRIRAQTDGRTVYDLFQEYGILNEISDRDPVARISRITEYLRPRSGHVHPFGAVAEGQRSDGDDENGGAGQGAPRLYIFRDCAKLTEYLPQYRWRPQRSNFSEEEAPEKPRKKDDHNIDCLGHILVALDDLPEVEGDPPRLTAEQRFLEEHFEHELEIAQERSAIRGYRPGRIPSAV